MALSGLTGGKVALGEEPAHPADVVGTVEGFYAGKIPPAEIARIRAECEAKALPLHDALMDRAGWPPVELDGQLLVTQQDALLMGGKVQAPAGYADHVVFLRPEVCQRCTRKVCFEICSAEAIRPGEGGVPAFDREKCVHCGACLWSCTERLDGGEQVNLSFRAGAGGLHSAEN
jgi:electron-transferring-flavoprotein dehydrogenase